MTLDKKIRWLVWSHYAVGLLQIALGCLAVLLVKIGWPMLLRPEDYTEGNLLDVPPDLMGLIWVICGVVLVVMGWLHGLFTIASGICISRRTYRGFSLMMGGINLTMIPIGPILCYYCFALLNLAEVQRQYEARQTNVPKRQAPVL